MTPLNVDHDKPCVAIPTLRLHDATDPETQRTQVSSIPSYKDAKSSKNVMQGFEQGRGFRDHGLRSLSNRDEL